MPAVVAKQIVPNINEAVRQYARLKDQAAEIEAALKELRPVIETELALTPEHKAEFDGIQVALTVQSRENFNLKAAVEAFGKQALNPFISTSEFTVLRLKVKA